ncbi:hypothetical protein Tco_0882550 [Tanacetum coccineum]
MIRLRRHLTIRRRKRIKVQRNDPKRSGHRREGPKKDVERLESNLKTQLINKSSHSKEIELEVTSTRIHVVRSLETLMRLHSFTWATKWFKRLVAYAKCNRDSYESELGRIRALVQETQDLDVETQANEDAQG